MTTEEAIAWFEMCKPGIARPGARAMYEKALEALRAQQAAEKNEPLTLDELRQMDGEPVYIQMGDGRQGYAIIVWDCGSPLLYGTDYDEAVTGEPDVDFYGLKYTYPESHFGLHCLGWLAYRHKPKEGSK